MAKGDARSIGNVYIQFLHVTGPTPLISTWPTKTITRPFRSGNAVVFRFFRRAVAIGRWYSETDDEDGHLREALSAHDTDLRPEDLRPEDEPLVIVGPMPSPLECLFICPECADEFHEMCAGIHGDKTWCDCQHKLKTVNVPSRS